MNLKPRICAKEYHPSKLRASKSDMLFMTTPLKPSCIGGMVLIQNGAEVVSGGTQHSAF